MKFKAVGFQAVVVATALLCLAGHSNAGTSARRPTPSPAERYAAWLESNRGLDRERLDFLFFEVRAVRMDIKSVRVDISIACPETEVALRARAGRFDPVSSSLRDPGKAGGFATRLDSYSLQFPSVIIAASATDDVVGIDLELRSYLEEPLRVLVPVKPAGSDPVSSRILNVSPKPRSQDGASPACTGTWWTLCCADCWNCGTGFCMKGTPNLNCVSCTYSGTSCTNCAGNPASCSPGVCGS